MISPSNQQIHENGFALEDLEFLKQRQEVEIKLPKNDEEYIVPIENSINLKSEAANQLQANQEKPKQIAFTSFPIQNNLIEGRLVFESAVEQNNTLTFQRTRASDEITKITPSIRTKLTIESADKSAKNFHPSTPSEQEVLSTVSGNHMQIQMNEELKAYQIIDSSSQGTYMTPYESAFALEENTNYNMYANFGLVGIEKGYLFIIKNIMKRVIEGIETHILQYSFHDSKAPSEMRFVEAKQPKYFRFVYVEHGTWKFEQISSQEGSDFNVYLGEDGKMYVDSNVDNLVQIFRKLEKGKPWIMKNDVQYIMRLGSLILLVKSNTA